MIAEWDTDTLFLSDRLEATEPSLVIGLRSALLGVPIGIIPDTNDIWCRDYMPVQVGEKAFLQFMYDPDYLRGFRHLTTPADKCRLQFMKDYRQEPIVLDGGNVVACRTKVILTDKVFKENPTVERTHLRRRLEGLFGAECVFIPKEPYDPVGHSDGVVRFVSERRVLVNDYSRLDQAYGLRLRRLLVNEGLEVETLPMFQDTTRPRPGALPSAVGLYVNFLRVGDVVVLPGYDRPEDAEALEKVRQAMPGATVHQVPCRSLAERGGVLNCVSWTIRTGPA
jgi:agmatine deiminase